MSLTASRQALQSIRGSVESALTKIAQIKTDSSALATDSNNTYTTGLTTANYSDQSRENAIKEYHYANYVNEAVTIIDTKLKDILFLIDKI